MNSNLGGYLGAALGITLGIAFVYLTHTPGDDVSRRVIKPMVWLGLGGGFAGNYLWSKAFGAKD